MAHLTPVSNTANVSPHVEKDQVRNSNGQDVRVSVDACPRYGTFEGKSWGFLLFHLNGGDDKKICTAVEVKGKFLNPEVLEIRVGVSLSICPCGTPNCFIIRTSGQGNNVMY